MKNKSKITVIVPIGKYSDEVSELLQEALNSIKANEGYTDTVVIIAGNKDTVSKAEKVAEKVLEGYTVDTYVNEDNSFETLVNGAAFMCTTPFFSVLEYDSVYMPNAFFNFDTYKEVNNASVYLNIVKYLSSDKNENGERMLMGFANEVAWASSFAEDYGFIGNDEIAAYLGYSVNGGFIRTEEFIRMKGLDKEYKLASWYDYLSKVVSDEKKVYVIPRCGYMHILEKKDSYTTELLSTEESRKEMEGYFLEIQGRHVKEETE